MAANIGIHFIDMLHWIFGPVEKVVLHHSSPECSAGFLQLKGARVRYFLSVYGQTNEKYKEDSRKSNTADRKPITYSRASNFGSKNEM